MVFFVIWVLCYVYFLLVIIFDEFGVVVWIGVVQFVVLYGGCSVWVCDNECIEICIKQNIEVCLMVLKYR